MANKYLEKIAGIVGGSAKAVGRVIGKGTKAVGTQVYKATGGTYIDHARKLGVTDPYELAKFGNKDNRVHKLWALEKKKLGAGASREQVKAHFQTFKKKTVPGLHNDQTDARIIVGGTAAGAAYGAKKLNDKMNEPKVTTYNY